MQIVRGSQLYSDVKWIVHSQNIHVLLTCKSWSTKYCFQACSFLISFCRRKKHGLNKCTNGHVCKSVYTFTSTQAFQGNIVQRLLCHLYWMLGISKDSMNGTRFVHTGVDRGWHNGMTWCFSSCCVQMITTNCTQNCRLTQLFIEVRLCETGFAKYPEFTVHGF
jgi:hypothetical protein